MKRKDKARELIKTAVLGTAKGLSSVAQTNPILTILLTFLESILEKFFDFDKEKRDKVADSLKLLGKTEIKKLIDIQDKKLAKYSGMLADLTEEFCSSIKEIKEQDQNNLSFIKKKLVSNIIKKLDENQESLTEELQELKQLLEEALLYIKNDPSESLVIPASPELGKEEIVTTIDLLKYSRQWIPLIGRDGEMKDLMKFADDSVTFSWWGVQGPGGCGKSRLALEWIQSLKRNGWKIGFIRKDNSKNDLNGFLTATEWLPMRDTAIVVDYGHEISDFIPGFIKDISNRLQGKECGKLRLLILDRASSGESWWLTMMDRSSNEAKRAIEHTCFKTKPIKDKYGNVEKLEPILINIEKINSADDQVRIIHNSIRKFKKDDNFPVPSAEALLPMTKHFAVGRPLYLIMLGISIAEHGIDLVKGLTREEILDEFIKREVGIWREFFGEKHIDQAVSDIGFITLCNGLPSNILNKLPSSNVGQGNRDRDYKMKLKNVLYVEKKEDGEEFINPLVPDILGERFVLTGGAGERKEPYFNASDWIETCLEISPDGLGQTILRSFQDFDQLDVISQWLDIAFNKIPDDLDVKIYWRFLSAVSILILVGIKRGHKLKEREWIERFKNLAEKNIYLARLISKLIIDIFNMLGSGHRWSELEDWGGYLSQIRSNPQLRDDREIALHETKAAVNAIGHYGSSQKWDELERWGDRIRIIRFNPLFRNDWEIARAEAKAAFNAVNDYGSSQKWVELEQWGKKINDLRGLPAFKTDRDIAFREAEAAFNVISDYGSAQKWDELEQWGERVRTIRLDPLFKDDREIAYEEAKAAVNAIRDYGFAHKWVELEQWGKRILNIRKLSEFKNDREIALAESTAAFNAISHYGSSQKWIELERWGERIRAIRLHPVFKNDLDIAFEEAKAVVNAISYYGPAHKWIELERWGERIRIIRLNPLFKGHREITLAEVNATYNAINHYGPAHKWVELERWGERIRIIRLNPLFRDDWEIALEEARAAVNAINHYGSVQKLIELERWGERIRAIRQLFKDDQEIALEKVKAAVNAINHYGSAHKWVELERWGERIRTIRLDPLFRDDREIAFHEVNAAFNAILAYGSAQKWVELEGWGKRIRTIRLDPLFKDDREIALIEANASLSAIIDISSTQIGNEQERWSKKAIKIYNQFRFDYEIISVCLAALLMVFLKHSEYYLGAVLIDIAETMPWLNFNDDLPSAGICTTQVILDSDFVSQTIKNRALELRKNLEEFEEFKKEIPSEPPYVLDVLKKLWANRRFLPYWGKDIWKLLPETGETNWIQEALKDPWNSPEDRELLEKLLKEHTGNKE